MVLKPLRELTPTRIKRAGRRALGLIKSAVPRGPSHDFIQRFRDRPGELYAAVIGSSMPLKAEPGYIGLQSSLCKQVHFSLDEFRYWSWAIGDRPRLHRKLWEWFFVIQTLFEHDMLRAGRRGLAFAVGRERLPALFAARGCEILATDLATDRAMSDGWIASGQHADGLAALMDTAVCPEADFLRRVTYRDLDMNAIPDDVEGFDFCWSSCSFEHLGSLEHGMAFVETAMRTLKPGGIAVHTTEFNLSSNDDTLESKGLSIYRRRDIEELIARLERAGHRVAPIDWTIGEGFVENVVDLPPYLLDGHLRIRISDYDCTSIGLAVVKG